MNTTNGKQGEKLFQQIMQDKGYVVEDVTGNPDYWYKDIDFIITSPATGSTKTFEVKYDSKLNKTGNLYLELVNAYSLNGNGWYNFCEADYIAYGDAITNTFYIIPLLELREKVSHLPKQIAQCGNESIGQLVSLDSIRDIYQIL